jgi:hypothetical protein
MYSFMRMPLSHFIGKLLQVSDFVNSYFKFIRSDNIKWHIFPVGCFMLLLLTQYFNIFAQFNVMYL